MIIKIVHHDIIDSTNNMHREFKADQYNLAINVEYRFFYNEIFFKKIKNTIL